MTNKLIIKFRGDAHFIDGFNVLNQFTLLFSLTKKCHRQYYDHATISVTLRVLTTLRLEYICSCLVMTSSNNAFR